MPNAEEIKKWKNHLSDVAKRKKKLDEEYRQRKATLADEEMKLKAKLYDLEHS